MGPGVDSPLTRYFTQPVLPTVFGFDPRLQFVHEDDAVEVLRRMATEDHPGTFNVAGDGVLLLSQCARRAGLLSLPCPLPRSVSWATSRAGAGLVDFSPEQLRLMCHGRVVDTTRWPRQLGWKPKFSHRRRLRGLRPRSRPGRRLPAPDGLVSQAVTTSDRDGR